LGGYDVNDGSVDTTGRNCFKMLWSILDLDIFSKENEGLGKARITVLKEPKEFTFYH
jgi:hypothetical protein